MPNTLRLQGLMVFLRVFGPKDPSIQDLWAMLSLRGHGGSFELHDLESLRITVDVLPHNQEYTIIPIVRVIKVMQDLYHQQ